MTGKEYRKYLVEMTEAIDEVIDKYLNIAEKELTSKDNICKTIMTSLSEEDSKQMTRCTLYMGVYALLNELLTDQLGKMSEEGAKVALNKVKENRLKKLEDLPIPPKESMN